jgi:MscS family membrane protein
MKRLPLFVAALVLTTLVGGVSAQETKKAAEARPGLPTGPDRPLSEKLRSPRETLKTLYFSVIAYDAYPLLIADAVVCLDLRPDDPVSASQAALFALQLETVLRDLCLPLAAVPEQGDGKAFVLYDQEGFRIAMCRRADGQWRFDRDTVERIPGMWRATQARHNDLQKQRAALRENYTDPAATMRRFQVDAVFHGDYYAAAQALDLSNLTSDERRDRGVILAQQLAFVLQRRGWVYYQEVPNQPEGPPYTWHADEQGRILLERVPQPDGKDAWLFSRRTINNLPRMVEQARKGEPDFPYLRLGKVVRAPELEGGKVAAQRPESVPSQLGSPRAVLKGFFRTMDAAELRESRLTDALGFLDLRAIPEAERGVIGGKLAGKLEAVLRKVQIDLATVPEAWNAPPQVFGEGQGFRIEILRQPDGCWRFSAATVGQVPAYFDKLAAKERRDRERTNELDSARDTMVTFLTALARGDEEVAAQCLDLDDYPASARADLGPVLAAKLKFIIDRIGRVYPQEIPDEAEGPRYVFFRSELGRIAIARTTDGPRKGLWLFTAETVQRIEPMFRAMLGQPVHESVRGDEGESAGPTFWDTPGIWLRLRLPAWAQFRVAGLDAYHWVGLVLALLLSWVASRLVLAPVHRAAGWLLRKGGSTLSTEYVARHLQPLTWVTAVWFLFRALVLLDLPTAVLADTLPLQKFLMAFLVGWLALRLTDLVTAVCTNSELLRPHRSLSDMVVPVSTRAVKGALVLLVMTYFVYQLGQGESLAHFLTGLGVAGLAASLAAQDALKNFFGTLLLIGERSFKLGDRIIVNSQEGVVEQVGFRSTSLRTGDGSLLTVPNATIANAPIDNRGARAFRRYHTTFVVGYDTPIDHLTGFRDALRSYLRDQPQVSRDKLDVYLNGLKDNGVELSVSLQLETANDAEEKELRDQITCAILQLAETLGASIANFKRGVADGPVARAA